MWKVPRETEALGNRYTQRRDPHTDILCQTPASGSLLNPHAFSLSLTQAVEADRGAGVESNPAEVQVADPLLPENLFYSVKRRQEGHNTIARATMTFKLPANSP